MSSKKTVVVGMSGGVDSSVSALLLKQQGYEVIGLFMKNWEEKDELGICRSQQDYEDAQQVCNQLSIPCYTVQFVEEYKTQVFSQFIEDFKKGLTPNPDVLCNREIKFNVFFKKALELGADYLATGHYCQNIVFEDKPALFKGKDGQKDQSYFLHAIQSDTLKKVLFPIGGMKKKEVRAIAKENGLLNFGKKDSTGLCFIGERNFRTFLSQYIGMQPGNFETLDGKVVGQHVGTAFYTIGQRKGLGIGGPGEPWFVVGKDMERGVVRVVQGANHPSLYCRELVAEELSWVNDPPLVFPYSCQSKIRYRQEDCPCIIQSVVNGRAHVLFPEPQRAVTPGQSIVFYQEQRCLGGGVIHSPYAKGTDEGTDLLNLN